MESTFITILDLSLEARILYCSDSIVDILGFEPRDVVNRSCWDFFHPEELPFAKAKHGRGVEMDKAAVLSYCSMVNKQGDWVGCEVVFTVVYDVLVGCISVYRSDPRSESRALVAPAVRRLFSSSPRDPRYHMLSHLSSKFQSSTKPALHEPRAALFLNRFTRTLTIMYATNGLADVLGLSGDEMTGRSFYYCIQENCLRDAIRCLEHAKVNDSIAYLRFWFRDPRTDDRQNAWHANRMDVDLENRDGVRSSDDETDINNIHTRHDRSSHSTRRRRPSSVDSQPVSSTESIDAMEQNHVPPHIVRDSRESSGNSNQPYSHENVFGESLHRDSSASSVSQSPQGDTSHAASTIGINAQYPVEVEAIISCTSDGMVVCLRRAKPLAPTRQPSGLQPSYPQSSNGVFAVPWASEPILPNPAHRSHLHQSSRQFAPGLTPAAAFHAPINPPLSASNDFMNVIKDCAVFSWALTGINGSLADYSRGTPFGDAQPREMPVWQSESQSDNVGGSSSINTYTNDESANALNGNGTYTRQSVGDRGQ